jgi:arginine/serine-rich coiled-coil protein 2
LRFSHTYKDSRKRDDREYRHEKDHRRKDDYSDRRDRRYKDDRSGERRSSSSYQKSSDDKYSDSRRPPSKDYDKRPDKQQFRKRTPSRSRSKSPSHATKSVPVTEPLVPQRSPPSTSNNLNVAITNNPRMERIRNMKLERLEKLGIDISSQFGHQAQLATPPPSLLTIETTAPPGLATSVPPPAGITLPAYYNPAVINPTKYADQVQKRKLLWSGKKSEPVEATKWGNTKFSQDTEGKVASKFMRLMGIKNAPAPQDTAESAPAAAAASSSTGRTGSDTIKKQEELFSTMEQQYEVARQVTHTMRGVGLGFGTSRPY